MTDDMLRVAASATNSKAASSWSTSIPAFIDDTWRNAWTAQARTRKRQAAVKANYKSPSGKAVPNTVSDKIDREIDTQ